MYTIDIETRSDKDISKCGVYAYTDTPYFDILLFAYSVDGQPVQVVNMANDEEIPENILAALADENVVKRAFNCNFERICLSKYLHENNPQYFQSYSISEDTVGDYLSPENWHCSMIHARTLGLPSSLAEVGKVLGIEQQKMTEGKALIKFFCTPYDTIDGVPQFHNPKDYPEKWEIFKAYNKRDVEAELEIDRKLSRFPVPDFLWKEFYLDQEINDRGILVDMQLADKAIYLDAEAKEELTAEMKKLTGVENPNSVYQLLDWLETQGYKSDSLGKAQVQELIKTAKEPVKSVLQMRLQLSKSSVKKYQAMEAAKCKDNRVRGMFSFYGASRTGRFCSKVIQIQNLPQNHLPDLTEARELVKYGSFEDVQMLYDDVPDTLSQLIRTAFIPRQGMKFIVADFSAIEARVIAWLADEEWRMNAFANGEDIYCASASKMFGVPVVKHGENGHLRQKGKVAELACIAEGQLVLTNHGLIPIEKISVWDKVWDGIKWVSHEGVICRGERRVITYDGLTATPDHLVWIDGRITPVPFGIAAVSGSQLVKTGDGVKTQPYSWTDHVFKCEEISADPIIVKGNSRVYDLKNAGRHHRFTVSGKLVHNCGYGGSIGAMKAMGADSLGLSDAELKQIVTDWREASPHITELWWAVDRAVKKAIREKTTTETHGLKMSYEAGFLFIKLPSGRRLAYAKPRIGENQFGGESVTYMGINAQKKWDRLETFGGKLTENICQSIARDLLMYSMQTLSQCFIVAHVHDEMIIEASKDMSLEEVCQQMARTPKWAEGLILRADGYECEFYKKD
ncbi:DNA polymerase [uncultured Ruminococcus sp.]|uniref:DNA polymerase n=1 Tax=uncultured Ruminococcus sp. TaxID=165186 RepID=UPI00345CA394